MFSESSDIGTCGHKKAEWDNHPHCLSCCGCSKEHACLVSREWVGDTWKKAAKHKRGRTYASRRKSSPARITSVSGGADFMAEAAPTTTECQSPVPPLAAAGSRPLATSGNAENTASVVTSARALSSTSGNTPCRGRDPMTKDKGVNSQVRPTTHRSKVTRDLSPASGPMSCIDKGSTAQDKSVSPAPASVLLNLVSDSLDPGQVTRASSPTAGSMLDTGKSSAVKDKSLSLAPASIPRPQSPVCWDRSPVRDLSASPPDLRHRPSGTGYRSLDRFDQSPVSDQSTSPSRHRSRGRERLASSTHHRSRAASEYTSHRPHATEI